jgi:hypothetical protein
LQPGSPAARQRAVGEGDQDADQRIGGRDSRQFGAVGHAAAASLHQQTQQLKEAVSVFEISETVLRTQQMDDTRRQAAAFALSGMRAI